MKVTRFLHIMKLPLILIYIVLLLNGCGSTQTCTPNEKACDGNTALVCNSQGSSWDKTNCSSEEKCNDGICIKKVTPCSVTGFSECKDKTTSKVCLKSGSWVESKCVDGEICTDGKCKKEGETKKCVEGKKKCNAQEILTCKENKWVTEKLCQSPEQCIEGICKIPPECKDDSECSDNLACQNGICGPDCRTNYRRCSSKCIRKSDCCNDDDCDSKEKCMNGTCTPSGTTCNDVCKENESKCIDTKQYQVCVRNSSGCFVWSTKLSSCSQGQVCISGKKCEDVSKLLKVEVVKHEFSIDGTQKHQMHSQWFWGIDAIKNQNVLVASIAHLIGRKLYKNSTPSHYMRFKVTNLSKNFDFGELQLTLTQKGYSSGATSNLNLAQGQTKDISLTPQFDLKKLSQISQSVNSELEWKITSKTYGEIYSEKLTIQIKGFSYWQHFFPDNKPITQHDSICTFVTPNTSNELPSLLRDAVNYSEFNKMIGYQGEGSVKYFPKQSIKSVSTAIVSTFYLNKGESFTKFDLAIGPQNPTSGSDSVNTYRSIKVILGKNQTFMFKIKSVTYSFGSDDINVYLFDSTEYNKYVNNQSSSYFSCCGKKAATDGYSFVYTAPTSGNYYVVLESNNSTFDESVSYEWSKGPHISRIELVDSTNYELARNGKQYSNLRLNSNINIANSSNALGLPFVAPNDDFYYILMHNLDDRPYEYIYAKSRSRQEVTWDQIGAIYSAIKSKGIKYVNATGLYTSVLQYVNYPSESLLRKSANCVDGSLVFASALEKLGMHPVLISVPGHMYVGVYNWNSNGKPVGPIWPLETTMVGDESFYGNAIIAASQRTVQELEKQKKGLSYVKYTDITQCRINNISDSGQK